MLLILVRWVSFSGRSYRLNRLIAVTAELRCVPSNKEGHTLEVEKELGLKSKKEIEAFGVAEFNQRCKKSVWKYLDSL